MRKRKSVLIVLLLGIGIVWWLAQRAEKSAPPSQTPTSSDILQKPHETTVRIATGKPEQPLALGTRQSSAPATDPVGEYVRNTIADPEYDWKQPISFYGRAVDENERPVEGAAADFKWTDLSANGTSEYHTASDASGLFSMVNQKGKRLSVTASKPGYYGAADARLASFEYANPADGLFMPDPNRPVVFHLRKKGVGVDLITSKYGMRTDFPFSVPREGTPVKIDFLQRKAGATGQMQVSEVKPEYSAWKQATSWSFKLEITDGGFIEQDDEFPFEAPESGYQSVVEFKFAKGDPNWTTHINKKYYIKFGNPPRYGHMHIETSVSNGGALLSYAINPDGSRYLEPK